MEVQTAVLWFKGESAGHGPALLLFRFEVDSMKLRNDLIMVMHESSWKADLLL